MKKTQVNSTKKTFVNFQKVALNTDQRKKLKGGTDVVTEDLADI